MVAGESIDVGQRVRRLAAHLEQVQRRMEGVDGGMVHRGDLHTAQRGNDVDRYLLPIVALILVLHKATNGQMNAALERIAALDCVKKTPRMIRVENFA